MSFENLTHDQRAVHFGTWEHIHEVRKLLTLMQVELGRRALVHDASKLLEPEASTFAEFTPRLKHLTYGSDEYRACLREMGPAVKHHQQNNDHHPEAHAGGVDGMTLVDILEMVCDWKAATLRTLNGDIYKSLEVQRDRFGISDQLMNVLKNTVDEYLGGSQ